ncbi:EamA-like transporter family protein [Ectothiorhodospira mobilis]|uniref:EamA-like transporter family protein n=1 Tax=Ectothiorhodospira mobilis TaxID=195064 RepID=A0A1I4QZL1_ECTMO|nr:DMT family transporter [Ectothiorhodospira mobilis]SFM45123.1 EamA-like transporter family protein [Ectothiorhodospira mobilis]
MQHGSETISGILGGVFSVILWSGLPVLRGMTDLPPLQVAAVALGVAALMSGGVTRLASASRPGRPAAGGAMYWIAGVGGLAGALYFYFLALGLGDPAVVTLITYTWPLGFVLAAELRTGRRPRPAILTGATIAFAGIAPLLAAGGGGPTPAAAWLAGLASGGAWIAFSLYLRDAGSLPFGAWAGLFGRAAGVVLFLHLALETTFWGDAGDWLAAAAIGIGPYGLAFMTWGYALRHGPAGLLGTLTYAVPVLASAALVALGRSPADPRLALAAAAVVGGALIASGGPGPFRPRRRWPQQRTNA